MKLGIIFFLCSIILYSQEYPKGILNLKWGDSKEKVINVMKSQSEVKFRPEDSDEDFLKFNYGEFAGRKVITWHFEFYKNQLCKTYILFDIISKEKMIQAFNGLVDNLKKKYGHPYYETDIEVAWGIKTNNNSYLILCHGEYIPEEGSASFSLIYADGNLLKLKQEMDKRENSKWNKDDL